MALRKTVSHTCDRDVGDVEATHLDVRFCIEGQWYEGDLCDAHYHMLTASLSPWRIIFHAIDDPDSNVHQLDDRRATFTRNDRDDARRAAELRSAQAERERQEEQAKQAELTATLAEIERLKRTIPGARSWTITGHARQRMALRNFSVEEVLRTVAQPELNWAADPKHGEGRYVYSRKDVRAVVDPRGKAVITVIDRNDHWDNRPAAERTAL